jgi:hypothetical protein
MNDEAHSSLHARESETNTKNEGMMLVHHTLTGTYSLQILHTQMVKENVKI